MWISILRQSTTQWEFQPMFIRQSLQYRELLVGLHMLVNSMQIIAFIDLVVNGLEKKDWFINQSAADKNLFWSLLTPNCHVLQIRRSDWGFLFCWVCVRSAWDAWDAWDRLQRTLSGPVSSATSAPAKTFQGFWSLSTTTPLRRGPCRARFKLPHSSMHFIWLERAMMWVWVSDEKLAYCTRAQLETYIAGNFIFVALPLKPIAQRFLR